MSGQIISVKEEEFSEKMAKGVVLVDFYADWCGPCRMLTPVLEQVASDLAESVKVLKVDIDQAQKVATNFQVTSVPTLILFKEGQEAGRIVGLRDAEAIKQFVRSSTA